MGYREFFADITGKDRYHYQERLGEEDWPDLVDVPTGMGKTAGVVVAWLWKRLQRQDDTPRRLVYCLPMRVLVEQTHSNACNWAENASGYFENKGLDPPGVYLLMGGDVEDEWELFPERDAILIGTQDILLSRALNRGYAMSRYKWPVHFGLLHNDAMWVYDEVQLMGAGLPCSSQLEAFRRSMPLGRASRSMWISATISKDWLATVDFKDTVKKGLSRHSIGDIDRAHPEASRRLYAEKSVQFTGIMMTDNKKETLQDYASRVAEAAYERLTPNANTLVIVNSVKRAQAIYKELKGKGVPKEDCLLLHSRFRAAERRNIESKIKTPPAEAGRIIVATQAIEAGVDISSAVLLTEIAPWPSLVQRFGRCNRHGELNGNGGGLVLWIDINSDQNTKDGKPDSTAYRECALPYKCGDIDSARTRLENIINASPGELGDPCWTPEISHVLRCKDFLDLFNTDPDLSGFDVDISPFIRDSGIPQIQVFWREWEGDWPPKDMDPPSREELCPVSISQAKEMKGYFKRDSVEGLWSKIEGEPRPGMTLLLKADSGGYDPEIGFDPAQKKHSVIAIPPIKSTIPEALDEDRWSVQKELELRVHLDDAAEEVASLAETLKLSCEDRNAVVLTSRWHDVGKAHAVFQATMHDCPMEEAHLKTPLLAKSPSNRGHQRKYFRHELASMLCWLEHHGQTKPVDEAIGQSPNHFDPDLVAYLIAAHHGKVRTSLRAWPVEKLPPDDRRFARGIWEGDIIPGFDIGGDEATRDIKIRLDLMELGEGEMGPSWTARVLRLIAEYEPFRLSWLEALTRIADWRASAKRKDV